MSSNKKYYWLKLKDDFFDEKYVKALRRLPQGDSLVIVYLKMQLKSLKTEGIIKYEGIMPDCISELSMALDEDENITKLAVEALIRFGAIERWENDTLYMVAMQQLIGSETQGAERVRKHRALKEKEQLALQCNTDVTKRNTDVTKCNTEIDIDIDKDTDIEKDKEKIKKIDYQQIADMYNETCVSLPRCTTLSNNRKKAIKARLNTYSIEDFKKLFTLAEQSDFLKGKNERNWSADFDWLLKDSNFVKVLEEKYKNRNTEQSKQPENKEEMSEADSLRSKGYNPGFCDWLESITL